MWVLVFNFVFLNMAKAGFRVMVVCSAVNYFAYY